MKIKSLYLAILMMLPARLLYCQVLEGVVVDANTMQPIPYVNIGIISKGIGTVSDEKGGFQLPVSDKYINDKIGFSYIGYYAKDIEVDSVINLQPGIKKFYLTPRTYTISEVFVRPMAVKNMLLGNGMGSKHKFIGLGSDDMLGREIGAVIPLGNRNAFLKKAIVRVAVNNYGTIKLRLNIYNLKDNMPFEKINIEPIYFETNIKEGKCVVDLEKYNIKLSQDFFVSMEYIQKMGNYGLYFTFSFDKNPTYFRETSLSPWILAKYEDKIVSMSMNVECDLIK
jgi:hypothetical protein